MTGSSSAELAGLIPSPLAGEHFVCFRLHSLRAALLKAAPHTGGANPPLRESGGRFEGCTESLRILESFGSEATMSRPNESRPGERCAGVDPNLESPKSARECRANQALPSAPRRGRTDTATSFPSLHTHWSTPCAHTNDVDALSLFWSPSVGSFSRPAEPRTK